MDIVLRATILYLFVLFVMRVTGRRELSSLSPVDLVLLIVLGDAIQQGLTQSDYSVTGAIIAVSSLATLQLITSYLTYRSTRARKLLSGQPIVIIDRGRLVERNLQRERMSREEIDEEMRMQQIASIEDVEWAILESNGSISFIKRS